MAKPLSTESWDKFHPGQALERWLKLNVEADTAWSVLEAGNDVAGSHLATLEQTLKQLHDILLDLYQFQSISDANNDVSHCLQMLEQEYQLKETMVRTVSYEQPTSTHLGTFRALWRVQPYWDTLVYDRLTNIKKGDPTHHT